MMFSHELAPNPLKQKLKDGKKTAGAWLHVASPITAEIMSRAGFDWLLIDMEHGPGDILTLIGQLQAMNGSGVVPLVRVAGNDPLIIKRVLDAGALGVLVPNIQTKAEAEAAYAACKYYPEGMRGIAGNQRAAGFGLNDHERLLIANERNIVMIQIESPQAVANLDEILEVKGIDVFFVGPRDLATSMGYFNNPAAPQVQEAIATIERKVLAAGRTLATVSGTWEQSRERYNKGYQMLTLMSDGTSLSLMAADMMKKFRADFS
jgi:2-dehydro-3-deoxyglucarate aldolase/4-hydroxy-2-oxoheptanedioate aldolase